MNHKILFNFFADVYAATISTEFDLDFLSGKIY